MPMLWLLLLPLASVLRSASGGGNTSCTEQSCGDLTIRFPFSLAGAQPLYCGYPVFDLTCDAGQGRAYLNRTFRERLFHVTDISYASNTMVAAIAGHRGCPVPDFNVSTSLALFPFTISAANKRLVFFYDCNVPPELRLPLLPQLCGNRTVGAYISGRWGEGDTLPRGIPANCSSVSVPVRGGMEPASLLYYELLMADGFLLDLPPPLGDCDGCRRVRGECRLDRLSFMCVCPDGKLCPNFAQSNSTTHPDRGNFKLKIIGTGILRDGSVVAVKRLYKNSYKSVEQFENEVDILWRLRHANLVAFYGCTSSSQGSSLVEKGPLVSVGNCH